MHLTRRTWHLSQACAVLRTAGTRIVSEGDDAVADIALEGVVNIDGVGAGMLVKLSV